jgi:putative copper export protein/mono/diheme cytochrome c family protein
VIFALQAILRGVHMAALLSLFGTLAFLVIVAPAAMAEAGVEAAARLRRRLLVLAGISAATALLLGVAWLTVESALIADANGFAMTLHALPVVALRTQFGQWLMLRLVLLILVVVALGSRRWGVVGALALAGMALAEQPLLGHAGAVGGSVGATLIVSEILHLVAAGAWLGALLPLLLTVDALPTGAAAVACRGFTPVGLAAVVALAATAALQVSELMGGVPGLFGTGYGRTALVKLALFLLLLVLAAVNRLALTDRLADAGAVAARRAMRLSIAIETILGIAVVVTAAFLASHTPGTHEQPVWPFPWKVSFDALADPDLRAELIGATLAVACAVGIGVLGLLWRRWRWGLLAIAVAIFALALRHFDLLLVEAYPTSFFTSPTEFAASAIGHGAVLFQANCAICHGVTGRGDGAGAKGLVIPPADLTADHLWAHSDGEMYWYVSHGYDNPEGGLAMPGFAASLSSGARWDLIDYVRAHNAGDSVRRAGVWSHPVQVPQFDADCADGRTIDLDDLRGRALLIVAGDSTGPLVANVTTVVLATGNVEPGAGVCVAHEAATWDAFAVLAGVAPGELAGTRFLADSNLWLRALWRPGVAIDAAQVGEVVAHPLALDVAGGHAHHH